MTRESMLAALDDERLWDILIIGGGATGLGCAIDAAARGYRALLLEGSDFAKGTSSRSTKLVHGGVRYLRQGNVSLVLEALQERGNLLRNAPHLVRNLPFVVPNYDWWEGPFYGIGLKMYDLLAGRQGFGSSKLLSRERTLQLIPTLEPEGLSGGVIYYDGQFDDARLAINMAQTAVARGATLLNYFPVVGLLKNNGEVAGVQARDAETGAEHELRARVVINATGVFTDTIRRMDTPSAAPMIAPSQGVHIVLPEEFLPGASAIMVPKTDDGRVLFAIPWLGCVVVGTTDTPVDDVALEPRPFEHELDFLLGHAARYLTRDPQPEDVLSTFAGLRPLVSTGEGGDTASLSRDHTLHISRTGLVTITGGKWTTYRRMAEDTINQAALLAGLEDRPCPTRDLPIHGHHTQPDEFGELAAYGADAPEVRELIGEKPEWAETLHPEIATRAGEVVWAARHEMARTVEDFLSRRTRTLLLNARASIAMAPPVAKLLSAELDRDEAWEREQIAAYRTLAAGYLLAGGEPAAGSAA